VWRFLIKGALSESTATSNFFKRRSQQSAGIGWHDIFGLGLDLSYSQFWMQETGALNDQVRHFWDQRDRVSSEIRAGFKLAPWLELAGRFRTDDDQLYSNFGGAVKEDAGIEHASRSLVEARFNLSSQTRLFVVYCQEKPFGYYTYYDPRLLENYSGIKLESTF
jgi:hypothetical protein